MKAIRTLLVILAAATLLPARAELADRPVGAGPGSASPYATDAYPGFDSSDEEDEPERKEKSWWRTGVKYETPATQYAYVKDLWLAADYDGARKAADALVREWPAASEAAEAQRIIGNAWVELHDLEEAFDQYEYLVHFYPGLCPYAKVVNTQYEIAKALLKKRRSSIFGVTISSYKTLRHRFEAVVRHAPGAKYVPEAMLTIAKLRVDDGDLAEAIDVYENLVNLYPDSPQALDAVYLESRCRYDLVVQRSYNLPRCRNAVNYLRLVTTRLPQHPHIVEMTQWLHELEGRLEEDAYANARFYDSAQRTPRATVAAYERFLDEYPESKRAPAIRARIRAVMDKAMGGKSAAATNAVPAAAEPATTNAAPAAAANTSTNAPSTK